MRHTVIAALAVAAVTLAWSNGPAGNATTNLASECDDPPYATHDWIADHALALLSTEEAAWLQPHRTMYLLGTEAPDNDDIPSAPGAPNTGYDDRRRGHSVDWNDDHSDMIEDRAAFRALQEYDKAVDAYADDELSAAAFYLGAMAHYVGDVSQYGHTCRCEDHHSDYENWAKRRTDSFNEGVFESYIVADNRVRRRPFTAVRRISRAVSMGQGDLLSAEEMDAHYANKDQEYLDSAGTALNIGVNELADVHSLRRKLATDHKDGSLKVLCELGGWKSPKTVLECYQQPDLESQRAMQANRHQPTPPTDTSDPIAANGRAG